MKRPRDTDNPEEGAPQPRRRDPNAGADRRGRGSDAGRNSGSRERDGVRTPQPRKSPFRTSPLRGPLADTEPSSDRPRQIAGEIRRAVQTEITRGLNDPRVQGMVSITAVDVTPDLAEARLKVSVLPEERASLTLSGLRAAAGFLRRRVMDETRIGRVPRLLFDLDAGLKRESALEAAIRAARHHEQDGAHDAGEEKRHDESESKTT
ncbi:MAG: 30S ribosome-binding factor RbfA [Limnohabitans sp.]|nr:30S ribosome-binding factor RbfA [Limnohabitans sp.]